MVSLDEDKIFHSKTKIVNLLLRKLKSLGFIVLLTLNVSSQICVAAKLPTQRAPAKEKCRYIWWKSWTRFNFCRTGDASSSDKALWWQIKYMQADIPGRIFHNLDTLSLLATLRLSQQKKAYNICLRDNFSEL